MTSKRTSKRAGEWSLFRSIALACALSMTVTSLAPMAAAQGTRTKRPGAAAPAAAGQAAAANPAATSEPVMLNFVNADIDAVVRAIGQYTSRTFVVDPRVKGTLSLVTERPVTREQAYEQLLTALRLQGFTIVQTGNVARVLPEADAKLQGGAVVSPQGSAPRGDQLVTQVFRLQYESATAMVPILRPLIAPNNTISAYPQNNTLVITDYADNLRRIQRIIESIDTPATSETEIIPIKFGLAMEIATVVNRMLDEGARAAGQAIDAGQRVSVLAEPRTNALILRAPSAARMMIARSLIAKLDQPALTPGNINVVYLRNAEAAKIAPLLRAIISADPSFVPQTTGSGLSPSTGTTGRGGPDDPAAGARQLPRPASRRDRRYRRHRTALGDDPGRPGDELADHHGTRTAVPEHPADHRQAGRAPRAGGDRVADRRGVGGESRRVRHPVAGRWAASTIRARTSSAARTSAGPDRTSSASRRTSAVPARA